ncbi:MAG: DUF763 domain-containing protein [Candidatus Diapherotrites archaeon]
MELSYAELPLHYGKAPAWLFKRMVALAREISNVLVLEFGTEGFLEKISDPFWFQALGCVLGFDWHSSGLTTTTCGALKEALNKEDLGIAIAGGKGKVSKKTPGQIVELSEKIGLNESKTEELVYASRMSAKVDNVALQDSYKLYHHCIFFDEKGHWAVVQQGMNEKSGYARRYHWESSKVKSFDEEPHKAICCNERKELVLNLTAKESRENKKITLDLVKDNPENLNSAFLLLSGQKTLTNWNSVFSKEMLFMPKEINWDAIRKAYEFQPMNYEEFLGIKGIGPNTVRALALISELVYGSRADWKDPVKYSFTVGGKDGVPFPVKIDVMDEVIEVLNDAVKQARINNYEKIKAIKRLKELVSKEKTKKNNNLKKFV